MIGINPATGAQKFSLPLPVPQPYDPTPAFDCPTTAGVHFFSVVGTYPMIIAGDGNAYLPFSYLECNNQILTAAHIRLLQISSGGSSNTLTILDTHPPTMQYENISAYVYTITNADTGVLLTWSLFFESEDMVTPTQYGMAVTSGTGVAAVTPPTVPGQPTNLSVPIAPILQAQDGSFLGIVQVPLPYPNNPQNNTVSFDASGNFHWMVQNETPQIATADGGFIGQSGATYDQNGNVTGQGALPGQYSWIGSWYGISAASVIQATYYPALDAADTFAAFAQGNSSQNRTANRPIAKSVQQLIAQAALSYVGSTNWLDTAGHNQCNIFVKAVLQQVGLTPPMSPVNPSWQHRAAYLLGLVDTPAYPAQAKDWATPSTNLKCWRAVTVTQVPVGPKPLPPDISEPGDVIAQAINYSDATGHVGIIVGTQQTASADSAATCVSGAPAGIIDITNFGFRPDGWVSPQTYPNGSPCSTSGQKSKAVVKRFVCQ